MFTPLFQPLNYLTSCQLFHENRAQCLCAIFFEYALGLSSKKTCISPAKYSEPFAATLADFQGYPLSTFQSNPESASKLKSSQPLLAFTHWPQNGYTNVNTIVIFSSVLLEHIFHFNFFSQASVALQYEPLHNKGEQGRFTSKPHS